MIVLAIVATIAAFGWSVMVIGANGMRSSPGPFEGRGTVFAGYAIASVFWLAWWFS